MGNIGMGELLIIFLVALLIFGAKRLPEIARGLGQGISEFKKASREIAHELQTGDLPDNRASLHKPAHSVARTPDPMPAPAPTPPPIASAEV